MSVNRLVARGLWTALFLGACANVSPEPESDLRTSPLLSACPHSVVTNSYDGSIWWGTIEVRNDSPAAWNGVVVSFDVPAGVRCDYAEAGWNYSQAGDTCSYVNPAVNVAPGATLSFHYSANSQAFSAASELGVAAEACASETPDTPPAGSCDYTIVENAYDGPNWWGTITLRNDGDTAWDPVRVAFDVPTGVRCDYAETGWTYAQAGDTCTYERAGTGVAPGSTVVLHYSATSQAFSAATNVAFVGEGCTDGGPDDGGDDDDGDDDDDDGGPDDDAPAGAYLSAPYHTYYWLTFENDFGGAADTGLPGPSGATIANVRKGFADTVCLEGSGVLSDGRVINLAGGCNGGYRCVDADGEVEYTCFFFPTPQASYPWGVGDASKPLVPFRSIAANDIPQGAVVYSPEWDGVSVPSQTIAGKGEIGGFTHDGCFRVDDVSWSFAGAQVDFFVVTEGLYEVLNGRPGLETNVPAWPSTGITLYDGGERCAYLR